MTWFAFKGYNTVDLTGLNEKEAVLFGFHGYSTEAQANAHPNTVNDANKAIVNILGLQQNISNLGNTATGGLSNLGSDVSGINTLIKDLTSRGFYIRVGECLAGALLIYAGVRGLTEGNKTLRYSRTGVRKSSSTVKSAARKVRDVAAS